MGAHELCISRKIQRPKKAIESKTYLRRKSKQHRYCCFVFSFVDDYRKIISFSKKKTINNNLLFVKVENYLKHSYFDKHVLGREKH